MLNRLPQLVNFNFLYYKAIYVLFKTPLGSQGFAQKGSESLITQISTATSPHEILEHYRRNNESYQPEHVILSLRMLGRLSKSLYQDLQNEENKRSQSDLARRLENSIHELTEFDLVDVLFYMRKMRQAKLTSFINFEHQNSLIKRLTELVAAQTYTFRNLVNIYYDLAMLGKQTDFLVEHLKQHLTTEPTQVTPFIAVQMLQAASKRAKVLGARELIMIDRLLRLLQTRLDEFDLDQKSSIFKYIAQLEMHYHIPGYRIPQMMFTLKQDIQTKVESLSEFAVLNVIQGYESLPGNFQNDLIDEVKEMVHVTLEHNASNLKNGFLLDFTELMIGLNRRRLDENRLKRILMELNTRLRSGDLAPMAGNIDKVSRILSKVSVTVPPELLDTLQVVTDSVVKEFVTTQRTNFIPYYTLEFLQAQKRDVKPLLLQIESPQVERITVNQKFRFLGILGRCNDPHFQPLIDSITQNILSRADQNVESVLNSLESINLPTDVLRDLIRQLAERLKASLDLQQLHRSCKAIYLSIVDRSSAQFWMEWLDTVKLDFRQMNRFIDDFQLEPTLYHVDNISFFLQILTKYPREMNMSRLLGLLVGNPRLTNEIARNDGHLRKLLDVVKTAKELRPQDIRLSDVLSLCLRLEHQVNRIEPIKGLIRRVFDLSREMRNNQEILFDSSFIAYMIKHGCLTDKDALELMQKAPRISDKKLRANLLALAQQVDGDNTALNKQVEESIKDFTDRLANNSSNIMMPLPVLLSFRPSSIRPHDQAIVKVLKDNHEKISDKMLVQLVHAIPRQWISQPAEREILYPITKELINIFLRERKQSSYGDIVQVMEGFVELRMRNTNIYNKFLLDVGANFETMHPEQRVRSMKIMSRARMHLIDFYQKMMEKAAEQPKLYRSHIGELANALFRVGVTDANVTTSLESLLNTFPDLGTNDSLSVLAYFALGKTDLAPHIQRLIRNPSYKIGGYQNQMLAVLLTELASRRQIESAQVIKGMFSPEDYKKHYDRQLGTTHAGQITASIVGQLLTAMKVEYVANTTIDGLFVNFHIPNQKIIISMIKQSDIDHDYTVLSGEAQLRKRILETIPDHKVIVFSFSQLKNSGHTALDKVTYLIEQGVASNTQQSYDFSGIPEEFLERKERKDKKPSNNNNNNNQHQRKPKVQVEDWDAEIDENPKEPI